MFRKLSIIAAVFLAITSPYLFSEPTEIINPAAAITTELFQKRTVNFTNNMIDLRLAYDFSDEQFEAATELLKRITVMVNNRRIASEASVNIPLDSSVYKVTLRMQGRDAQPLLNTIHDIISKLPNRSHRLPLQIMHKTGLLNIIAGRMHLEITFEARLDENTDSVEIIYPLINQIEDWEKNKPNFTLHYSFPLTFELKVADNKLL